ncbi:MAG: DUF4924 family protein [Bacteroidales bacterium]|jgi:hypothetical protein|nr:DUF4924 family protein [Bacteroidales bacterium]
MIIATQKRQQNIAEYILYMWQLEDMIRAVKFDVSQIVSQYNYPENTMKDIQIWYTQLADAMKSEGIEESGHLRQLQELVIELSQLNISLLQNSSEKKYQELFNEALPHIAEIITKSDNTIKNEIEACLMGLYGMLLLRLQRKTISENTNIAITSFSRLLAVLSKKFHELEKGNSEL